MLARFRQFVNSFNRFRIDAELRRSIKSHQNDIILVVGVVLISLLSFALGYISAKNQEKTPLKFEQHETAKYGYHRSGDNRVVFSLEAFGNRA